MLIPKRILPSGSSVCFCCSLTTCCNVQGFAVLVYDAVALCGLLFAAVTVHGAGDPNCKFPHRFWPRTSVDCSAGLALMILGFLLVLYVIISFAATIAFLRGIFLRCPSLFLAHNVTLVVHLTLDLAFAIWASCALDFRVYILIPIIAHFALWLYFLVCAETLYHEMLDGVLDGVLVGEVDPERVAILPDAADASWTLSSESVGSSTSYDVIQHLFRVRGLQTHGADGSRATTGGNPPLIVI